jgi:8-oxo-dGTP diphosphatase
MDRETIVVTGAIIPMDGRVLVARRHSTSRFEPGRWEFPGGKLEFGEHPKDAIRREIKEELGVEVSVDRLYDISTHVYSDPRGQRHVLLLFYVCRIVTGSPIPLDCAEIGYATREELDALPFVEGDKGTVSTLIADDGIWLS